MENNLLNAITGACVADALGVPVEFKNRETLSKAPVTYMRSYGTHNQKAGTWSDDTSMTLCLIDSLSKGLDNILSGLTMEITHPMERFLM